MRLLSKVEHPASAEHRISGARTMVSAPSSPRYRAVSMELAAYLDGHYVEMHIVTETGEAISIVCPRDSIFAVQRHIERIGHDCPQIASWNLDYGKPSLGNNAAMVAA